VRPQNVAALEALTSTEKLTRTLHAGTSQRPPKNNKIIANVLPASSLDLGSSPGRGVWWTLALIHAHIINEAINVVRLATLAQKKFKTRQDEQQMHAHWG
jgi:NaMN:DMB phosphoribosyltransferase